MSAPLQKRRDEVTKIAAGVYRKRESHIASSQSGSHCEESDVRMHGTERPRCHPRIRTAMLGRQSACAHRVRVEHQPDRVSQANERAGDRDSFSPIRPAEPERVDRRLYGDRWPLAETGPAASVAVVQSAERE